MKPATWYRMSVDEALQKLGSSVAGLSNEKAHKRFSEYGPNTIPAERQRSILLMLLGQFADFMIMVLLAAALISGIIGEPQDTIAILVIILLNAIMGTVQEFRAERAVAALREMAAPDAQVFRDGQAVTLTAVELVPGDVVVLEAGNIVPADLRLLEVEQMQVDESSLTGESQPVDKLPDQLGEIDLPLGDRRNLAFKSSLVTRGRGIGVVVATGVDTEIGRIAELLRGQKSVKTPLQQRLVRFGRYLALAVLVISALVFIAGLLQGQPFMLMFLTAVSLAVAAIPEALPAVVTISLALGARKLIRYNALVRNLPAVETLGSVTYICADKTGTLTQNHMSVEAYHVAGEHYADFPEMGSEQKTTGSGIGQTWQSLGHALALNNDVILKDGKPAGEPTEMALFEAADKAGFEKFILEQKNQRIATIPFDSQRKQMTTLYQSAEHVVAYIKGAPERVLSQSTKTLGVGNSESFDVDAVLAESVKLANQGYRVLALAMRVFTELPNSFDAEVIERDLSFIGLVALIDPARPEVPEAVADCLRAGITPVMITGDHPGTAMTIACSMGIAQAGQAILSGDELDKLSDEELIAVVESVRVYARVAPEQKLRIVKALQEIGEVVAMTGDGGNDAPALKRANIGVAMGLKGTDVAREASDLVLLDDNFTSIVRAVRAGRRIFDNIRKFIKYTMSSNSGEIWTIFLAPFFGLPIPLLPIHILWINLVTDGLPGLALTAEPAEPGIMSRAPRPPNENIFAHGMWQHIIWVGLFIGGISLAAMSWAIEREAEYWQTVVFTVLTVSQLFHSLAVRSETTSIFRIGLLSNLPMLGAIVFTLLLQLAVIYLPALNIIFHTQPLPLFDLAVCLGLSSLVLLAVEIEKAFYRKSCLY